MGPSGALAAAELNLARALLLQGHAPEAGSGRARRDRRRATLYWAEKRPNRGGGRILRAAAAVESRDEDAASLVAAALVESSGKLDPQRALALASDAEYRARTRQPTGVDTDLRAADEIMQSSGSAGLLAPSSLRPRPDARAQPLSSRNSHALALSQSRRTVRSLTFSASAVSPVGVPREVTAFDNRSEPRVETGEPVDRCVELDQGFVRHRVSQCVFAIHRPAAGRIALHSQTCPGRADEDMAHGLSRCAQEVSSVGPALVRIELEPRLVHERGRLIIERPPEAISLATGEPAKLRIQRVEAQLTEHAPEECPRPPSNHLIAHRRVNEKPFVCNGAVPSRKFLMPDVRIRLATACSISFSGTGAKR